MPDKKLFKTFFCSLLFISYLVIISMSLAEAADLKISVKLNELATHKSVDANVVLEAQGSSKELVHKNTGRYELKESLGTGGFEVYIFNIEPQKPYFCRSIAVKGDKYKDTLEKSFTFSIAKETEFTYRYLNRGLKYFDLQDFDSALAHYEIAYINTGQSLEEQTGGIDMFSIQLGYNYAKALHNTCTYMKYDNCERASNLFQKLLALYENRNYRNIFRDLKISKDNLTKSLNDVEMNDNNVKYSRINELFKEQRYLEAANLSAEGVEDFEKNPEVFSKIGLTKDRLLTDAGVSYLKEAEKAEKKFAPPDEIQNLLENALCVNIVETPPL